MRIRGAARAFALAMSLCFAVAGCDEKHDSSGTGPPPPPAITWQATGLSNGTVEALAVNNVGIVFASIEGDGVYRSADNGVTWTKTLNGPFRSDAGTGYADCFFPDGSMIFAGTDGAGVFCSTDETATWTAINGGQSVGHVYDIKRPGSLFCASDAGIFRLDDPDGWARVEANAAYALLSRFEGWPNQCIYAGGPYQPAGAPGIIIWSSDNGGTWYKNAIPAIIRGFARNSSGEILAVGTCCFYGESQGVFRIGNWFAWEPLSAGLAWSDRQFQCIAAAPADVVFIGSMSTGVFRSADGGDSWTQENDGLMDLHVLELAVNPAGHVYAGTMAGVFRGSF
jgi:hypothetical protein